MDKVIFENPKRLTSKDIYIQILVGLGFLCIAGIVSSLRHHGQPFALTSTSFFIFAILLVVWIFKAIRETTLKIVRVENEDVTFVLDRQLRIDQEIRFHLNELQLDIKKVPSRSLPPKKVLIIRDSQTKLEISSRQKGLSESVLKDIVEKLKHLPQQNI